MAVCWECFIFESLIVNLSLSWAEFTYCSSLHCTSLCYDLNLATGRKSEEFGAYIRYFPYLQFYSPILYEKNGFNICYYLMTWAESHLFDIYLVILPNFVSFKIFQNYHFPTYYPKCMSFFPMPCKYVRL